MQMADGDKGGTKRIARWTDDQGQAREAEVGPLASLRKAPRKKIKAVHPRRALSVEELGRLLKAAEERPLLEMKTVRTGKNRGQSNGNVHPRVRARMARLGKERKLCYLLAAWAGLRRSEVKQLRWGDIHLDYKPPQIRLRGEATKAKRADNLYIHPELQDVLRTARPADAKPQDAVLGSVPDMKAFRADLKHAGVADTDATGHFVDFHSFPNNRGGRHLSPRNIALYELKGFTSQKLRHWRSCAVLKATSQRR